MSVCLSQGFDSAPYTRGNRPTAERILPATADTQPSGRIGRNENEDVREIRNKVNSKVIPEEVRQQIEKELGKLDHIPQQSPDYNVQLSYLQTVASLPWGEYTKDKLNIKSAERILNKDHYGLEKVKERIWNTWPCFSAVAT